MTKNKEKKFAHKIGIGVTEHNRPEIFAEFLENIKKFMPPDTKLVIVDDASTEPVKGATFRFETNVGIARAKNKCLELLQDCEHIFLFDSDCWPKVADWYKPYVEGEEPHYCYIFKDFIDMKLNDCEEMYRDSKLVAYTHARGCMLYLHNSVLDVVGGMDVNYKRWGYEHVDYSNRIYNAGLTMFRYQDVPNSFDLIHSEDEHRKVASTVSMQERQPYLQEMKSYFEKSFTSDKYCPFTEGTKSTGTEDIVLTCYFTSHVDTQRDITWEPDIEACMALINSLGDQKVVLLNDCFDETTKVPKNVELVRVETPITPYFQRWISEYQYLKAHPEIRRVFLTDSTDVEMINNPFNHMQSGKLYVGTEVLYVNTPWMVNNHRTPLLVQFYKRNPRTILLNCGLVGGDRADVMELLRLMNALYVSEKGNLGKTEMGGFNYICRTYLQSKLVVGNHIHTRFKAFDRVSKKPWWRHK
jgi:glycosyltransferase involved in cell wall biosynthesis